MNASQYWFLAIVAGIVLSAAALLHLMVFKPTAKIWEHLRGVRAKAESAMTKEECEAAWEELVIIGKDCWHRSLGAEAQIIAAILKTKFQLLSNKQ